MKVGIRVDSSSQIGTGHFMRCLTLADALKQRGAMIRFVSRHMPEYLRDMLVARGHEFMPLNSDPRGGWADGLSHSNWLGTSQHADAQGSAQVLSDQAWDWLVVDHYALDARWESVLRQIAKNILVIDDIADRQHDCDVLLDQNFYPDMGARYTSKVPPHCKLLLGPRYALLREEFRRMHDQVKPRTRPVKRVLVFLGGVDADNYTGCALEALINIPDLVVDVVIGAQHPFREQLEFTCAKNGFFLHVQTNRMAELIAGSDFAIGAGGSASWERCCLGLPTLVVSLADNQVGIAKALDLLGVCVYVGTLEAASAPVMHSAVMDLLSHPERLLELSEKSYLLVDGLGVDRLCQALGY